MTTSPEPPSLPAGWEPFWKAALQARENAHAPYSRFRVGAALKLAGIDEPIAGCNVENVSYGATLCAERAAFSQAVARFGNTQPPEWMIIVTAMPEPAVPCALCLQVMAEHCPPEFAVYLANPLGVEQHYTLRDLLPHPFTAFTPER